MTRTGGIRPQWHNSYEKCFLRDVHRLLALGYSDVRQRIGAELEEEDITGLIVEAIQDRLDLLGGRFGRYFIKETAPARSARRLGKRRRELDIVIECGASTPRRHFIIEAKRLRTNGYPVSKYTGDQGLLCFVRGDYAGNSRNAGMVGYVQSDTPERWFGQLSSKFEADASGALGILKKLSLMNIVPDLKHEWTSEHLRHDGTPITIFHILLVCC